MAGDGYFWGGQVVMAVTALFTAKDLLYLDNLNTSLPQFGRLVFCWFLNRPFCNLLYVIQHLGDDLVTSSFFHDLLIQFARVASLKSIHTATNINTIRWNFI